MQARPVVLALLTLAALAMPGFDRRAAAADCRAPGACPSGAVCAFDPRSQAGQCQAPTVIPPFAMAPGSYVILRNRACTSADPAVCRAGGPGVWRDSGLTRIEAEAQPIGAPELRFDYGEAQAGAVARATVSVGQGIVLRITKTDAGAYWGAGATSNLRFAVGDGPNIAGTATWRFARGWGEYAFDPQRRPVGALRGTAPLSATSSTDPPLYLGVLGGSVTLAQRIGRAPTPGDPRPYLPGLVDEVVYRLTNVEDTYALHPAGAAVALADPTSGRGTTWVERGATRPDAPLAIGIPGGPFAGQQRWHAEFLPGSTAGAPKIRYVELLDGGTPGPSRWDNVIEDWWYDAGLLTRIDQGSYCRQQSTERGCECWQSPYACDRGPELRALRLRAYFPDPEPLRLRVRGPGGTYGTGAAIRNGEPYDIQVRLPAAARPSGAIGYDGFLQVCVNAGCGAPSPEWSTWTTIEGFPLYVHDGELRIGRDAGYGDVCASGGPGVTIAFRVRQQVATPLIAADWELTQGQPSGRAPGAEQQASNRVTLEIRCP